MVIKGSKIGCGDGYKTVAILKTIEWNILSA